MTIKDIIGQDVNIRIRNQKEYITFLKAAEEEGILWQDNSKPMEHKEYFRDNRQEEFFLNCREGKGWLCWSPKVTGGSTIDFSDLDLVDTEKYILEIKYKDRKVSATLLSRNSVYIKHAIAKCHPDDKFDFETGKRIALQKLFEFEPVKNENETKHGIILKNECGTEYGIVGDKTKVEAFGHVNLFVGDIVEMFDGNGQTRGLRCVCKDGDNPDGFVMGVASSIFANGSSIHDIFGDEWLIIKRKSFNDMKVGDTMGVVKYVTSD